MNINHLSFIWETMDTEESGRSNCIINSMKEYNSRCTLQAEAFASKGGAWDWGSIVEDWLAAW